MAEMTYLNQDGLEVFTSSYLRNRKTCCQTACLHCPYGFTLKKMGLTFSEVTPSEYSGLASIAAESGQNLIPLDNLEAKNIQWILIKDQKCGFFIKNHIQIKNLYLKKHFLNQGLSKEMIESYFF